MQRRRSRSRASATPRNFSPPSAAEARTSTAIAPAETQAAPAGLAVLAVLSTLLAFASISTDLYLPALPAMTAALRAARRGRWAG
jgi:DHA1 family bicyclomycin/chloramphenicol resistance-like MFS transporter